MIEVMRIKSGIARLLKSVAMLSAVLVVAGVGVAASAAEVLVHYTFDQQDELQVLDQSGKSNNGTLYGAKYVEQLDGFAMQFEPRAALVKCAGRRRVLLGKGDFAIEFWLKLDGYRQGAVIAKKGQDADAPGWMFEYLTDEKVLSLNLSDGKASDAVSAPLADTDWHHIAAVRQGDTVTLYVDSQEVASKSAAVFAQDINVQAYLTLGKILGPFSSFQGKLDEVKIYQGAIAVAQIQASYDAKRDAMAQQDEASAGPRLVRKFTFDAVVDGKVKDVGPFGVDAVVGNVEHLQEVDGRQGVLRFDGKTSFMKLGNDDSIRFAGDVSFGMWVRQNTDVPGNGWGLLFGEYPPHAFMFGVIAHHSLMVRFTDNGENAMLPVSRSLLGDQWAHVAVVIEYPRARFYHNGELVRDAYMAIPGVNLLSANAKYLGGADVDRAGSKLPVDLDEFWLYRKALTSEEVRALYQQQQPKASAEVELAAIDNWYDNTLELRLISKNAIQAAQQVNFTLTNDAGETLAAKAGSLASPFRVIAHRSPTALASEGRQAAAATFDLREYANQTLTAEARVLDRQGNELQKVAKQITLTKPDWIQTDAGYSEDVLKPWTPMQADKTADHAVKLSVWGREVTFKDALLPQQIQILGEELLASPMSLAGQVDGQKVTWDQGQVELLDASALQARLKQHASSAGVAVRVNTVMEYDGYAIYECVVEAERDVTLDAFAIDMPMRSRFVELGYADRAYALKPGVPISEWFVGSITQAVNARFSSSVWLGDNKRGLAWQAESNADWHNADPQKAMQILPGGDVTTLRVNFVDTATKLAKGQKLHYKFALLPTPVKPMGEDAWDMRIMRSGPYGNDLHYPDWTTEGKPTLQYLAEDVGVRRLFYNVSDIWPWPTPEVPEFDKALRRLIGAAHRYGLKVHPYLIHIRFPVLVDAFENYGASMVQTPMRSHVQGGVAKTPSPRPGPIAVEFGADSQGSFIFCPKSQAAQDAYIHNLQKRIREYGDDGVYLDGTAQVMPCKNLAHGCGRLLDDGTVEPTHPVFACREFIKRIYTVVHTNTEDGVVDLHSWNYNPAQWAYVDMVLTGEQWWHLRHDKPDYLAQVLPLDMFRTMFMGYQVGTPVELLSYRLGSTRKIAATSLLHDVPVQLNQGGYSIDSLRGVVDGKVQMARKGSGLAEEQDYYALLTGMWQFRDAFDVTRARRLFYWENQRYVSVSPAKCYVTLWHHPTNGVLAFVTNLGRDAQDVQVQLNLDSLGMQAGKLTAFDPVTDEPVAVSEDGGFSLSLGSEEWAYVWVRAAK